MKPKPPPPKGPPPLPPPTQMLPPPPAADAEPEMGEDFGFILSRSKNRHSWQLTRVERGADGELKTATKGVQKRERFLLDAVRMLDEVKQYIWGRTGLG